MAEKLVNEATAALRALRPQMASAWIDEYGPATRMPTIGLHRKYMDHAVRCFAVACDSCKGSGLQMLGGTQCLCVDCGGFKKRLCPAAVRRLYQIVAARFPEVRARSNAEEAAQRWEARKAVAVTKAMYLGLEDLPQSVPQRPDSSALRVASITWRRGLRSEFLWAACEAGVCVLRERLPDLVHAGEPWAEVFAWARGGGRDPERSAQQLLQQGWAVANPAYDWLGSSHCGPSLGLPKAFSVTSEGLLSGHQLEWLFRAAARVRAQAEKRLPRPKASDKPQNIGPYSFGKGISNAAPKKLEAPHAPSVAGAVPVKTAVGDAQLLPFDQSGSDIARLIPASETT